MGLANTTTNLSYARNELIKTGVSFIFDKVGDMIYYVVKNNDIPTTMTNTLTVGVDGTGHDVKFYGDTSGSYFLWDEDEDRVDFVNARQNWTTTGLAITDAAGNARQLYGQFTADSIADAEHLTAIQLRASWNGSEDETTEGLTCAEFKARAAGTSVTNTLGTAIAIIGNVDAKKATFTVGRAIQGVVDIAAGGEITTCVGVRAYMNNSGTATNSYAFLVEAETAGKWGYGMYMTNISKPWYSSSSVTSSGSAFYLGHVSSTTSGNVYGLRIFVEGTGASTGMTRGIRCEAEMGASAEASLLEAGLFTAKVSEGSATVTNIRALSGTVSIGSSLTVSGDVVCVNAHMQTRSDEDVSGVHAGVYIKNEAVGGSGLCLADGAIYITEASLGGSVKGYECLIDASTATLTDQTGNEIILIKFKDNAGTVYKLIFDTDAPTVVKVGT